MSQHVSWCAQILRDNSCHCIVLIYIMLNLNLTMALIFLHILDLM